MSSAYKDSLDIANRACQHLGVQRILDVNEGSRQNVEISAIYDQIRQAELREHGWSFAKALAVLRSIQPSSRLLAPQPWDADGTYMPYAVVADSNGDWWTSTHAENIGNEPGASEVWDRYFGPEAVDLWSAATAYYAGELVYRPGAHAGTFVIFRSLTNNNTSTPDTADAWSATTTYGLGTRVIYSSTIWRSLITLNTNNTPAEPPAVWASSKTYATSDPVLGADGIIYTSAGNGNIGHDPVADTGGNWTDTGTVAAWESLPAQWTAASSWSPIYSNMVNLDLDYLQGQLGRFSMVQPNAFRLPHGCLRDIKLDPKHSLPSTDWEIKGQYLYTNDSVVVFPFIRDMVTVSKFDALFCEAFGARLAFETCETINQSTGKKGIIANVYTECLNKAAAVNGIELGPEEADEDEFITVRR